MTATEDAVRDTVTRRIDAPPEEIYDLISDPVALGRLSPECTGGKWLDGATGPEVGARFRGTNRRGWVRWSTTNTVVAAHPGREFAFETAQSGICWRYTLAREGDGTLVTERRERAAGYPLVARIFTTVALGGIDAHADELRAGMAATLERLDQILAAQPGG